MDDAFLVKQFISGDKEVFSELVEKYSRPITMMILKMLRDPEETKDLSQQVFLKAYEGLSGFSGASSFKTWLYAIAVNSARDRLRARKQMVTLEDAPEIADSAKSVSELIHEKNTTMKLREGIAQLPEKQRLALQLRVYEEMDYKKIAEIMQCSEGSARANFFQATKSLKRMLVGQNE